MSVHEHLSKRVAELEADGSEALFEVWFTLLLLLLWYIAPRGRRVHGKQRQHAIAPPCI